jgi:hypothetical protein
MKENSLQREETATHIGSLQGACIAFGTSLVERAWCMNEQLNAEGWWRCGIDERQNQEFYLV